jgi:hypothetical protein
MIRFVLLFLISAVVSGAAVGYWRIAGMPEKILARSMATATAVDAIDEQTIRAPINQLAHSAALYTSEMDVGQLGVTAPMADMLYSIAWVDVSDDPMIVSVPEFADRFYAISFTDLRNLNNGYIGTRVTGGGAGRYALVTSDWKGTLPEGVTRFELNTPQAQALLRVFVAGADDFEAADILRRQITFTPLSKL